MLLTCLSMSSPSLLFSSVYLSSAVPVDLARHRMLHSPLFVSPFLSPLFLSVSFKKRRFISHARLTIVYLLRLLFTYFFLFFLQLISGLGWALFEALDYGCKREEQNILSPDLEQMIDLMTSAGESSLFFILFFKK
jgi:hypothetical protein